MPEPVRRPSPFLFLLLGSPILKLCAAMLLAFGIVTIYVSVRETGVRDPEGKKVEWKKVFAVAAAATQLAVTVTLIFVAGDACIALVDMHRDTAVSREKLEKLAAGPPVRSERPESREARPPEVPPPVPPA